MPRPYFEVKQGRDMDGIIASAGIGGRIRRVHFVARVRVFGVPREKEFRGGLRTGERMKNIFGVSPRGAGARKRISGAPRARMGVKKFFEASGRDAGACEGFSRCFVRTRVREIVFRGAVSRGACVKMFLRGVGAAMVAFRPRGGKVTSERHGLVTKN